MTFKVLNQNFSGWTKENHKKNHGEQSINANFNK